jgi:TonB family protein
VASAAPPAPPATPKQAAAPIFGKGVRPAPGKVNPNLSQGDVTAIVGQGEIKRMREADGERRKTEHKGTWTASTFDKWRSSIENYVASVKPGNQTALNTAQSPFATYLNGMHNRIHPFFADQFLGSLDGLPKEHPLNNTKMITRLEIVLTKEGHLKKMGVVKTSGVTAFDIAALDSVNRAAPFGPAPSAIVSKDGNVYLHWEFHRDEVYACSTMNARPFLLNIEPPAPPTEPPPPAPKPTGPQEKGPPPANTPDSRTGWWMKPNQWVTTIFG